MNTPTQGNIPLTASRSEKSANLGRDVLDCELQRMWEEELDFVGACADAATLKDMLRKAPNPASFSAMYLRNAIAEMEEVGSMATVQ